MRTATKFDVDAISSCLVELARFVGSPSSDPYSKGLASLSLNDAREFVDATLSKAEGFAFIQELNGKVIGFIVGSIENTSFSPSGIGHIGKIEALWVDDQHRGNGIGGRLVAAAERRFRAVKMDVDYVELSFLAGNELACTVWERLGYKTFRVFSYKRL
ncbi:MAG: GNAT family N-acetyltransferase [Fuerstiella sp.]